MYCTTIGKAQESSDQYHHTPQGLLQAFVEHVKERKSVVLEDLAADFSMRVQVALHEVGSALLAWLVPARTVLLPCRT